MQPLVFSRIYLQSQTLESHFLKFEIFKRYIELDIVLALPFLMGPEPLARGYFSNRGLLV
jgi:hypothetical protein